MSIERVLARIEELNAALRPAPPPPTAGGPGFAGALEGALATPPATAVARSAPAARPAAGSYPHLSGDLDASPEVLSRLEALAARRGERFHVTSGHRSYEEQARLWAERHSNPYPVARPGSSRHESGRAADVTVNGRPIQDVVPAAELVAAGLRPLAGDAVHVELA